jgi:adenylate cyclase
MSTVTPRCAGCGTALSPDFAFCPRCGAKLGAAPDAAADRRPVTVLFADLAGFTALGERLDPEDVRALQSELFEALAAAVDRYEGFVEKFVGDAVMAVFGAPVAHEDDPERALRAALAMQERVRRLDARWLPRLGGPLRLHVGVHTGPVVAGSLGAIPGAAYAVTGDTVNTAARLQHAAEPGQVLVSEATYRLGRHAFAFEPLGELALKGKSEPIAVYRLEGALDAPRTARGLEALGLTAPLVGRQPELARMLEAFERMRVGSAHVVSLVGEAGVGKSRLVSEFLGALEADGRLSAIAVRRVACSSLGEQPYGVLASFLRDAYGIGPEDGADAAREKLAAGLRGLGAPEDEAARVARLLGSVLGLESVDLGGEVPPEQRERQIVLATLALLERRLQQAPLVLIVEDLHWADAASVQLLRLLLERLADRAWMLLATYRPAFDASPLAGSRAAQTLVRLAPLSAGDTQTLLSAFFGPWAATLPAALRELIVGRSGGNPFYVEEILRGLVAAGVLARGPEGWTCGDTDVRSVEVPATLQGLLLSRVDRLPAPARRVLQEAAVLGAAFDMRLLGLTSSDPADCEPALQLLRESELIQSTGPRQFRFTHALVQEVVYQNLLVRRRTELHERAGRALEELCGGRPQRLEDLEALGHHFRAGADPRKGARYLVAAGDWARALYANADAVRHYERALAVLAEGEAEWLTVRERLGDLFGPMGRRDAALEHYSAVLAASASAPHRARMHRKIGGLRWEAGDREGALACLRNGLAVLEGEPEHVELAHLYQEMGRLAFRSGDNAGALDWATRALAHAERLAPAAAEAQKEVAAAVCQAYNTLGVAFARTGRLPEAVARIEQSVAVAEREGLLHAACRGYTNLGVLYATREPGRAIETCLSGLATAKKIGDLAVQSRLYANLAVAYCALTDRCDDEGIAAARQSIDLDRRLGQLDHLAVPLIVLGQIYQCHGEAERALGYYREALGFAEESGEPQLLFPCYDGLATLHLDLGDDATAEAYMRKAQAVCERAGVEPDSLIVLPFLG